MSRYLKKPEPSKPHVCVPPMGKHGREYYRTDNLIQVRMSDESDGTVWQCDCDKMWRFSVDAESSFNSWRLLEGFTRWGLYPRRTERWKKMTVRAFRCLVVSVILCFVTVWFSSLMGAFFILMIVFFGTLAGCSLILDQRTWIPPNEDVQDGDEPIGDLIQK
jgi:hypothetical protein